VLAGYGVRVSVERGHLHVADNVLGEHREGLLARATAKLKRLVVLGHTGLVSLDAMRWLHDVGAAFVHIDADGTVITVSAPVGLDDARLRRAQVLAAFSGVALHITRELLRAKLDGQLRVLERIPDTEHAYAAVVQAIEGLPEADGAVALRVLEARAAAAYWSAWSSLPVRFVTRDQGRVPEHWRTFGSRVSPLTSSPRTAANPANALLNYLYALLESETRIALLTMGLDPGMGLLHADQRSRDSLACDLMETVRPAVDAYVLELLERRMFAAREFFETRTGNCRLVSPLPQLLCETAPRWRALIGPVVERVAAGFHQGRSTSQRSTTSARVPSSSTSPAKRAPGLPTPLTQTNRSRGRDGVRVKPTKMKPSTPTASLDRRLCRGCGLLLSADGRRSKQAYCTECREIVREEALSHFQMAGPAALARARAEGHDPSKTSEALVKVAATQRERAAARTAWERANAEGHFSPETFRSDILPALRDIPVSAIVRATGLSLYYCSQIRRGIRVPHPMYWESLCGLGLPTP
jgi:CRISPR-associated endonuclease Cas1